MKISLAAGAAFAAVFCFVSPSFAQQPAGGGAAPPGATAAAPTSGYTETRMEGNQVVTFPGDTLPGDTNSAYGFILRRPPGVVRALLIQPRYNFVPELLKSVENL